MKFEKFLRTPISKNICERLPLNIKSIVVNWKFENLFGSSNVSCSDLNDIWSGYSLCLACINSLHISMEKWHFCDNISHAGYFEVTHTAVDCSTGSLASLYHSPIGYFIGFFSTIFHNIISSLYNAFKVNQWKLIDCTLIWASFDSFFVDLEQGPTCKIIIYFPYFTLKYLLVQSLQ